MGTEIFDNSVPIDAFLKLILTVKECPFWLIFSQKGPSPMVDLTQDV